MQRAKGLQVGRSRAILLCNCMDVRHLWYWFLNELYMDTAVSHLQHSLKKADLVGGFAGLFKMEPSLGSEPGNEQDKSY